MIKKTSRMQCVAKEIQREIAIILQHKIKDPRIDLMTTISDVEVSFDLAYAKVYVTFLNDKNKNIIKKNIKILQNASSYIRKLLSKTMYFRTIPKITFLYDNSLVEGIKISNILTSATKKIMQN